MKYRLLSLAMFILAPAVIFSCRDEKERKAIPNLNKPRPESPAVKSISTYITDSGGKERLLQLEEFSKNGRLIKEVLYQADGSMDHEVAYTYDRKGRRTKAVSRYLDGSEAKEEHFYKDGRLEKTKWSRSDGQSGRHEYKYDDHDSLVQWDWFDRNRFVISRLYPNVYDERGNAVESWYKETDGSDTTIREHWQYSYDSAGRLTQKMNLNRYNIPESLDAYFYDSLGNKVIELQYRPDTIPTNPRLIVWLRILNSYNEYGELTDSKVYDITGEMVMRVENTYDEYGHLLESRVMTLVDGKPVVEEQRKVYKYYEK